MVCIAGGLTCEHYIRRDLELRPKGKDQRWTVLVGASRCVQDRLDLVVEIQSHLLVARRYSFPIGRNRDTYRSPSEPNYEYSAGLLLRLAIAGWLVIGLVLWPLCIYMASRSRRMGDDRGMTLAALIISVIGVSLAAIGLLTITIT